VVRVHSAIRFAVKKREKREKEKACKVNCLLVR
jgi:hypothetical protein